MSLKGWWPWHLCCFITERVKIGNHGWEENENVKGMGLSKSPKEKCEETKRKPDKLDSLMLEFKFRSDDQVQGGGRGAVTREMMVTGIGAKEW